MTTVKLSPAEKPFDLDEFSMQLGETKVHVTVPAAALPEVLKRVFDFMSFGIYVYSVVVIPAPSPTLDSYLVHLDRINFNPARRAWLPFREETSPPPGGVPPPPPAAP